MAERSPANEANSVTFDGSLGCVGVAACGARLSPSPPAFMSFRLQAPSDTLNSPGSDMPLLVILLKPLGFWTVEADGMANVPTSAMNSAAMPTLITHDQSRLEAWIGLGS